MGFGVDYLNGSEFDSGVAFEVTGGCDCGFHCGCDLGLMLGFNVGVDCDAGVACLCWF